MLQIAICGEIGHGLWFYQHSTENIWGLHQMFHGIVGIIHGIHCYFPSNPRKSPKRRCSWEYHHLNMVFNLTIQRGEMTLIGIRPLVYESSNARPSAADFWHS